MEIINLANILKPNFTEERKKSSKPYINFGANNLYPQELLNISDNSETHSSCLEFKNLAMAGSGHTNVSKKANLFLKSLNYNSEFTTLLNKIALSLSIFDGFALQIIWNKTFDKIVDVKFTPFENIRVGVCDNWGNPSEYFINSDWENTPNNFESIKIFDDDKKKVKEAQGLQLLYIINKSPKSIAYPNPRYTSAINYIFCEYELSIHQLSSIVNDFSLTKVFTFITSNIPSEEEKMKNKQMFDQNFRGTNNAGKVIIEYAESVDQKVVIQDLTPSSIVDQYINSSQTSESKILLAHGMTSPALLGLNNGNSSIFGNGEELLVAYDVFYVSKIKPYQKMIEDTFNLILEFAGFKNEDYKIIPFSPVSLKIEENETTEEVIVEVDKNNE